MSLKIQVWLIITTISIYGITVNSQRSPYAGRRPFGYRDNLLASQSQVINDSIDRFGESSNVITNRLPYDARGDSQLVNYYYSLPLDQRPFWLINYQAIEAHRNTPYNAIPNIFAHRSSFLG